MSQSKAHKYFNKFTGWAKREGAVAVEQPEALEELIVVRINTLPGIISDLIVS